MKLGGNYILKGLIVRLERRGLTSGSNLVTESEVLPVLYTATEPGSLVLVLTRE